MCLSYFKAFGWPLSSLNKNKREKKVEMNFIDSDGSVDLTHLDVSNFFENPNGKIDYLIGDGNVRYD